MPAHPRRPVPSPEDQGQASWPVTPAMQRAKSVAKLSGPYHATRPIERPVEPPRTIALAQCGHPLPWEAQTLYQAWTEADPDRELEPPQWLCPVCQDWRKVNIYPGGMRYELLF